eukprot:scaffold107842_cov69-Phaeocystis_antarctica.AAC.9
MTRSQLAFRLPAPLPLSSGRRTTVHTSATSDASRSRSAFRRDAHSLAGLLGEHPLHRLHAQRHCVGARRPKHCLCRHRRVRVPPARVAFAPLCRGDAARVFALLRDHPLGRPTHEAQLVLTNHSDQQSARGVRPRPTLLELELVRACPGGCKAADRS